MQALVKSVFFWAITIFLLSYSTLSAQIEVEPALSTPLTPEHLIREVFAGKGVEIVNISFQGQNEAIGYFKNGTADIGIEEGFLMTTGRALLASQPNSNTGEGHTNGSPVDDPTLNSIVNDGGTRDVVVYEIEFIPQRDTIEFKYVFASEEYPEFGCNCFNDVFGFFLRGPGYNDWTNLAIVPGTENDPVSVKTIHPLDPDGSGTGNNACTNNSTLPDCNPVNEQFFVDNTGSTSLTYDGLTTVLTAKTSVQACETYSIKLAIADVGDDLYDSAIFFEANSFGSDELKVALTTESIDGSLVEGCAEGSITFSFDEPVEADYTIPIDIIGNALSTEYTLDPAIPVIPAGAQSITVAIQALADEEVESLDSIGFQIPSIGCETATYWIYIKDNELNSLDLGEDQAICPGESIELDGTLNITPSEEASFTHTEGNIDINTVDDNGTGPDTDASVSTIQVTGVQPDIIRTGVIKEICISIAHSNIEDIDLFVESPSGALLELTTDNGGSGRNYQMTCFSPTATTAISAGTAPFTGSFTPEGDWNILYGSATNGAWKLYVKDDSKGSDGFLIDWSITFNPLYEVSYQWTPDTGLSCSDCPMPTASPTEETSYVVQLTDSYGCIATDSILIKTDTDTIPLTINCIEETQNSITFGWSPTSDVSYEVNVDGQGWEPASGAGAHTVRDLNQGQTVFIEVRGSGDCVNQKGETDCTTSLCFPPEATILQVKNQTCFDQADGQIDLNAEDPSIIFILNNDTLAEPRLTNLEAGNYSITALDTITTCFISLDTLITRPDSIILEAFQTVANCGEDNAIAAITPSGGTMPYSILWDTGQDTDTIKNLGPGTYTVRLVDDAGCTTTQSVTIEQDDTAVPMGLAISCEEVTTSSVTFSWPSVDGINLYEVKIGEEDWSDPAEINRIEIPNLALLETVEIQVRASGDCLSILDSMSCMTVDCILPEGTFDVIFEGPCNDYTDGVIALGSEMENLVYILEEDTVTNGVFEDLIPGNYIITLLDTITGCSSTMETELANRAPLIIETFAQAENCGKQDGLAAVSVSGGVAPYDIFWSNGEVGDTIRNLPTETYFVMVVDAAGCRQERRVLINLNIDNLEDLRLVVDCPVVTNNSITFTWEEIPNITDYEINVNGEGWQASNGTGKHELRDLGFSEIFNFQVRGNSDCGGSVIGNQICTTLSCIPPTVNFGTPQAISCTGENDGELEIFVNTFPFSFVDTIPFCVVRDSNGFNAIDFNCFQTDTLFSPIGGYVILGTDTLEATELDPIVNFTDLFPGTYTLQLMDTSLSCRSSIVYTIEEPDTLKITTLEEAPISCPEAADARIVIEAQGGIGPFEYDWNEGLHNSDVFVDIEAGNYTVVMTDANGCTTAESYTVTEPAAIVQNVYQRNNGCGETNVGELGVKIDSIYEHTITWNDGSTTDTIVNLSGGEYLGIINTERGCIDSVEVRIEEIILELETTISPPLCAIGEGVSTGSAFVTATGNDPTAYSYEWSDDLGQTTDTATMLSPGMYMVTVTDNTAQCAKIDTIAFTAPPSLEATIENSADATCPETNDGTISLTVEGGAPEYSIDWGDGVVQTALNRNDLTAGTYTITITDNVGCTSLMDFSIGSPDSIKLSLTATPINCEEATSTATVIATGGSGDFAYQWNDTDRQITPIATNLIEQTFQVIVTDNITSCTTADSIAIQSEIPFDLSVSSTPSLCEGETTGTATVEVTGGSGNFKYLWDDENAQETPQATNLAPGNYMILVIDEEEGCENSVPVTIEDAATAMEVSFITKDVTCNGMADGSSEATVEGASGTYQYQWSNGSTTRSINELSVGEYHLTVTDENGCTTLDTIQIIQPDSLLGTVEDMDVSCAEQNDGRIEIAVVGGSGNYEYTISKNQFFPDSIFTDLRANTYFVKARDKQGCEIDLGTIRIEEPSPIMLNIQGASIIASGTPINLESEVTNGQGELTYAWSSDTDPTSLSCTDCPTPEINPAVAQMYLLTVTDESGCAATTTFNVLVRKEYSTYVPTGFSPNSDGFNDLLSIYGKEGTRVLLFRIFDRWGELVFENNNFMVNDSGAGWDGRYQGQVLNPAVFTWYAEIEHADGFQETIKGHSTLIR